MFWEPCWEGKKLDLLFLFHPEKFAAKKICEDERKKVLDRKIFLLLLGVAKKNVH